MRKKFRSPQVDRCQINQPRINLSPDIDYTSDRISDWLMAYKDNEFLRIDR